MSIRVSWGWSALALCTALTLFTAHSVARASGCYPPGDLCCEVDNDCDDGNECTTDTCPDYGAQCVHTQIPDCCHDDSECSTTLACHVATCDTQNTHLCQVNAVADGTACDDNQLCTTDDACVSGVCTGVPVVCTNSGPCIIGGLCDPGGGYCYNLYADDGTPCDDGNACTVGETCLYGTCGLGRGISVSCDDDNPCTDDSCDPSTGCVNTPNTSPCDDGNACTTEDTCGGGTCQGTPVECSDGNPCTTDTCDSHTGCAHTNNSAPCDDHNACTQGDHCAAGSCVGALVDCDDHNPCTNDFCSPSLSATAGGPSYFCQHPYNSDPCNDGDACTVIDVCAAGLCHGSGAPNCDDGNPCTDDSCDPIQGCVHTNNTLPCDDGNPCTVADVCSAGSCHAGAPNSCDDGNPCTDDSCNAAGCQHTFNTAPCEDGNACTTGDTCFNGSCAPGTPVSCDDGNPCTTDTCHSGGCAVASACVQFECRHDPNTLPCNDQNACTTGDTCGSGVCQPGTPASCDDGNPCTDDSCNPSTGCVHTNNTAPCSDGNICTTGDHCSGGICVGGPGLNCDDGNPCTDDFCESRCLTAQCNGQSGCVHVSNTAPCSDGNACTTGDTCGGGTCHPGSPTNCDDGNCCTVDSCNPSTGCVHTASTTPPVFTHQPSLGTTNLWPPQHGYADFNVSATGATATASCGTATIKFASCASSQSENATGTGDGNTTRDCVYEPGALHLRAERDGACSPVGRVYTMTLVAVDSCGNSATSNAFQVGVFHDRAHPPTTGTIVSATAGSNAPDTRNGTNGTYGTGCGAGSPIVNGSIHDHSDADPEMEIAQHASIDVNNLRLDKASGKVRLTWTEPPHQATINVTRYHVYRLDPETLFWTQIAEVTKQTVSYIDPGLQDGENWQYKVAAVIK